MKSAPHTVHAVFNRGYTPKGLASPFLGLADRLADEIGHQLRAVRRRRRRGLTGRDQALLAITPEGTLLRQDRCNLEEVPHQSLCLFLLPFGMIQTGRVIQAEHWFMSSLSLNERYPRSHLIGVVYEWIIDGRCPSAYEGLSLDELVRIRLAMEIDQRAIPCEARYRKALAQATRLALQAPKRAR